MSKWQAGERVDRFLLLAPLGSGGQGEVWRAQDLVEGSVSRAIKLVPVGAGGLSGFERLRREAHALARLTHPSLVRCYGIFEDLARGVVGVVLELAEGVVLAASAGDGRWTNAHREGLLLQVTQVLAYLHHAGVVHRDLKPENLILAERFWAAPSEPGTVKLLDFGIALSEHGGARLTDEASAIGTAAYMAPESLDPALWGPVSQPSPGSDVFALGVLGWQIWTGQHPTGLPDTASQLDYALAYRRLHESAAPWPTATTGHPFETILRACLALAPAERLASGREVLESLERGAPLDPPAPRVAPPAVTPLPTARAKGEPPAGRVSPGITPTAPSGGALPPPARPASGAPRRGISRARLAVVVAAGLAVVGLVGNAVLSVLDLTDGKTMDREPASESRSSASPSANSSPPHQAETTPSTPLTATRTVPKGTVGLPPGPASTTLAPAEPECPCDARWWTAVCGSERRGIPFACGAALPARATWSLRLSALVLKDAQGKALNATSSAPGLVVRVCRAGTSSCRDMHVGRIHPDDCGRSQSLLVTTEDVTRDGLDMYVIDEAGEGRDRAERAHRGPLTTAALCAGVVFGGFSGRGFALPAGGPVTVERATFFLDEAPTGDAQRLPP